MLQEMGLVKERRAECWRRGGEGDIYVPRVPVVFEYRGERTH